MDEILIPNELGRKCFTIVQNAPRRLLSPRHLSSVLVTKENMTAVAFMPECRKVIARGNLLRRLRSVFNVLLLVTAAVAFYFNWWIAVGVVPIIFMERLLAFGEKECWMFLAASLLALEFLANNFAGWGAAYPKVRGKASSVLGVRPEGMRTKWLNLLVPKWENLEGEGLREFRPDTR